MTYYINPIVFYWINVAATIRATAALMAVILVCGIFICYYCYFDTLPILDEDDAKEAAIYQKWGRRLGIMVVVCSLIVVFVPNKSTSTEMLIAHTITQESVESAKEDAKELIDYIIDGVEKGGKDDD